ncbi:MAG: hypothetical protein AB1646_07690 [Thermodesulfobacteriota bacterium]
MKSPSGHARRLFLGFTCSIMFLAMLAILMAHNTEAESSGHARSAVEEFPLAVVIPTSDPEATIGFYKKLGFKSAPGFTRSLDVECLEKEGSPYKLEICHNRFSEAGPLTAGVSGMSFPVKNLQTSVEDLRSKGLAFSETSGNLDGFKFASLKDPNGINIRLFEYR